MSYRLWLSTITSDAVMVVAGKIGVSASVLNRQVIGKANMPPETIVKISRAYGANPIPGLVEVGLISMHEAETFQGKSLQPIKRQQVMDSLNDEEILYILGKRLNQPLA
jgi:hypothetical protein